MSNMRISGIASGIDTETMVRDLMKAERAKVNKLAQNKQLALWRQEQYNSVNKDFANFIVDLRKELELTRSTLSGITMKNSTDNFSWVKKATSSNTDIFTATATAAASAGNHKIKIIQLADGVNVASQSEVKTTAGAKAQSTTKLSEMGVASGSITFEIKVNGESKNITVEYNANDTIGDLTKKINEKTTTIDGKNVSLGLQASFDNVAGRLFLSTKDTGSAAQIKVKNDEDGLFIGDKKFNIGVDLSAGVEGKNAKIEFNGAQNLEYSSNNFVVNGIAVNLNKLSSDTNDEFIIKVETDVDGVYNKIKGFVDKYNELIDKMNDLTGQKRYKDFHPLSAEEKEAMKEEDIKKWEEKAKSGLLRNDEFISRTLGTMRQGLYEKVQGIDGKYNHLSTLGINTGEWKDQGKLVIDENKLKNAIREDVDGVLNLLFKESSITGSDSSLTKEEKATKRKESGLMNRLFDDIVLGMKDIISKSGAGENASLYRSVQSNILIDFVTNMGSISYLDKDIFGFEKTILNEESRLSRTEESYWRKFTAMEKALQQMNSQSSWLAQQLGGLN